MAKIAENRVCGSLAVLKQLVKFWFKKMGTFEDTGKIRRNFVNFPNFLIFREFPSKSYGSA